MTGTARDDAWNAGESYEAYMGRWSAGIAPLFLEWFAPPSGRQWLEIGCGTGVLSREILARCDPLSLLAVDLSENFVGLARQRIPDRRATFQAADAQSLGVETGSVDVVASALALNFIPDRLLALAELQRVLRPGGRIGLYVWDYPGGGLGFVDAFWHAACAVDARAFDLREDKRFADCTREGLTSLIRKSGLTSVECESVTVPTMFRDFDEYWAPFLMGAGPAPGYCAGLDAGLRERLKRTLSDSIPRAANGKIAFEARAWALKATRE